MKLFLCKTFLIGDSDSRAAYLIKSTYLFPLTSFLLCCVRILSLLYSIYKSVKRTFEAIWFNIIDFKTGFKYLRPTYKLDDNGCNKQVRKKRNYFRKNNV